MLGLIHVLNDVVVKGISVSRSISSLGQRIVHPDRVVVPWFWSCAEMQTVGFSVVPSADVRPWLYSDKICRAGVWTRMAGQTYQIIDESHSLQFSPEEV